MQSERGSNINLTNEVIRPNAGKLIMQRLKELAGGAGQAIGTQIIQRATDDVINNDTFRETLLDDSLFLIVDGTDGTTVCHVIGDECEIIDGQLDSSGGSLQHGKGAAFNSDLDKIVRDWYQSNGMYCTQNMRCDTSDVFSKRLPQGSFFATPGL